MAAPPRRIAAEPLSGYEYISAPITWDPDTPPSASPNGSAAILDNWLARPGKIRARPSMERTLVDANVRAGYAVLDNPYNVAGTGFVRYHYAHQNPTIAPKLNRDQCAWVKTTTPTFVMGNSSSDYSHQVQQFFYTTTGVKTYSGIPEAANLSGPLKSYTNIAGATYYVAVDNTGVLGSDATDAAQAYAFPKTAIIGIVGQTPTFVQVSFQNANCPNNMVAIKTYQQRLWVLGGAPHQVATPHSPGWSASNLFFSNPVSSATVSTLDQGAMWLDPVLLSQNQLNAGTGADPGMGMAVYNNRLIIFNFHSTYVMTGTDRTTYNPQLLSNEVGCIDQQSIIESDHGVYFMTHRGLYFTTGSSVVDVSGTVKHSLSRAIQRFVALSKLGAGGDITGALLSDGSMLFSIRACTAGTPGQFTCIWSGRYDPATNGWCRITSNVFAGSDAIEGGSISDFTYDAPPSYLMTDRLNLETLSWGNRGAAIIETPGVFALISSSTYANDAPPNIGRDHDTTNGQGYPAPLRWVTQYTPLSPGGRFMSSMIRASIDYGLQIKNGASPTGIQMVMNMYDEHYNIVKTVTLPCIASDASTNLPGGTGWALDFVTNPWILPTIQRTTLDMTGTEVAHISFGVILTGQNTQITTIEVYGIGVEFQQGRNLV